MTTCPSCCYGDHSLTHSVIAIKYIGTPAWKSRNTRNLVLRQEHNEIFNEEKVGYEEHRERVSA